MSFRFFAAILGFSILTALLRSFFSASTTSFLGDGWAQWFMAVTGLIALCVSVWAVYLLDLQLKATREAIKEAEKATAAAIDTVELTRDLGNKELRPWVLMSQPTFGIARGTRMPDGRVEQQTLAAFLSFRNYGKNPAINVGIFSNFAIVANEAIPVFQAPQGEGEATIAPTSEVNTQQIHISGEEFERVMSGRASVALYGKVVYNDPFIVGDPFVSECLLVCRYQGMQVKDDGSAEPFFLPFPVGTQNRAT
jgi:hypothetical protein